MKGLPDRLVGQYPTGIITGIRQHRAIDYFTDLHPTFRQARELLSPERRRLAGIIVDVYYDYFLSQNWPGGQKARREFIQYCHDVLIAREEWQPLNFREMLPRMISERWLDSYSSIDGLALTFRRVSTRVPITAKVLGAEDEFLKNQKAFEKLYSEFFPQLETFSENWVESQTT